MKEVKCLTLSASLKLNFGWLICKLNVSLNQFAQRPLKMNHRIKSMNDSFNPSQVRIGGKGTHLFKKNLSSDINCEETKVKIHQEN